MKTLYLLFAISFFAQCFHSNRNESCDRQPSVDSRKQSVTASDQGIGKPAGIEVTDSEKDSLAFEKIMSATRSTLSQESDMGKERLLIHIARALKGIPYVGQTLEVGKHETLVVNLRQLDCTTYVENVVAMYLCIKNEDYSYSAFKSNLRHLRYAAGKVAYTSRLHYFTQWIEENTRTGVVKEIQAPTPPFTSNQRLAIDFMSKHSELYPRLKNNPKDIDEIRLVEKNLTGKVFRYIPKREIENNRLFRSTIHNGDIIAITTKKSGLDTSHIGIAVWHKDGLHLLNASQIHKKVVEEPMLLRDYMQKHPSQVGIRIVRIN